MKVMRQLLKHLQTGVSFMLPVLIIGGACQGVLNLLGDRLAGSSVVWILAQISSIALTLAIPVAAAYSAYSVADKPALIPGLIVGYFAVNIGTGFVGAIMGALVVGELIKLLRQIPTPKEFKSIKAMLVLPLVSALTAIAILFYLLRLPLAGFHDQFLTLMNNLSPAWRLLLGAVLAGTIAIDMGGKKGNTVAIFANACLADGIPGPTPAKLIAAMVPPMILILANLMDPQVRKTREEWVNLRSLLLTGFVCQITESVLPYAMQNPRKMIPACITGCSIAGGLVMFWNVLCPVPHGGLFLLPIINFPGYFLAALMAGALTGAVVLLILRRFVKEKLPSDKKQELSDKDIWMNF